jgi:hypothetical protein
VELHTGILPPDSPAATEGPLDIVTVRTQLRPYTLDGHSVMRMRPELELVYIACHWAMEWRKAGSLFGLLDSIALLRSWERDFSWETFLALADRPGSAPGVRALLGYLVRRCGLDVPASVRRWLTTGHGGEWLRSRVNDRLVRRYVVEKRAAGPMATEVNLGVVWDTLNAPGRAGGRLAMLPWNLLFPPPYPDRYDPTFQLRRLGRAVIRRH